MTPSPFAGRPYGRPTSAALAALTALLLGGTAGCSAGPDITSARLERSIAPAFENLHNLQQRIQTGQDAYPVPFDPAPHCTKGGRSTGQGPGNDWACQVRWPSPATETLVPRTYEVTVRPTGCHTAQGLATLVGQRR